MLLLLYLQNMCPNKGTIIIIQKHLIISPNLQYESLLEFIIFNVVHIMVIFISISRLLHNKHYTKKKDHFEKGF